jgi:hypoxanthine phosphoribosyltransferase
MMHPDIARILLTEEQIHARTQELGAQISADYGARELSLICVLKGGVIFLADLIRSISVPLRIDFMATSSYGASTQSSGVVRILKDLDMTIEGRNVLIVEDIIDTGHTLSYLVRILHERRPASLCICTLLSKPSRREIEMPIDYVGFDISNEFVVGYGLDYNEKYRNLPYIGVLKPEMYTHSHR